MDSLLYFVLGVSITVLLSTPGLAALAYLRRDISWRMFMRTTRNLINTLEHDDWAPDVIVALNSGIVPASIVALNLRITELHFFDCLPVYRGGRRISPDIETRGLALAGKNVLLLDDQVYTGRSLERIYDHLVGAEGAEPARIRRHALFTHSSGAGPADLEIPAGAEVRGSVKRMPWVVSANIRHFWEDRR